MSGYEGDGLPYQKREGCACLSADEVAKQLYLLRGNHDLFERSRIFIDKHIGSYYRHIVIRLKEGVCIEDVTTMIGGEEHGAITPVGDDWADGIWKR